MGDIDFKVISATENPNNFQKTRFWKEKSVEDMVTLECLPFNSSSRNCDVPLVLLERPCKWDISLPCKIMSYVVSTLHYYEFIFEPMAQATLIFFNQRSRLELYLHGGININIKQSEKFPSEYPSYSLRAGVGGI